MKCIHAWVKFQGFPCWAERRHGPSQWPLVRELARRVYEEGRRLFAQAQKGFVFKFEDQLKLQSWRLFLSSILDNKRTVNDPIKSDSRDSLSLWLELSLNNESLRSQSHMLNLASCIQETSWTLTEKLPWRYHSIRFEPESHPNPIQFENIKAQFCIAAILQPLWSFN